MHDTNVGSSCLPAGFGCMPKCPPIQKASVHLTLTCEALSDLGIKLLIFSLFLPLGHCFPILKLMVNAHYVIANITTWNWNIKVEQYWFNVPFNKPIDVNINTFTKITIFWKKVKYSENGIFNIFFANLFNVELNRTTGFLYLIPH